MMLLHSAYLCDGSFCLTNADEHTAQGTFEHLLEVHILQSSLNIPFSTVWRGDASTNTKTIQRGEEQRDSQTREEGVL